jgi:RHS repeat-associated protein
LRAVAVGGQTLNDGQREFRYDENGCASAILEGKVETRLEYDVDGRLVSVRSPRGEVSRYTYDALGRRAKKVVGETTTDFLWEGCVLAAEGQNGEFRDQVYFLALEPVAQWKGSQRFTPVTGPGGAVYELLDERGGVSWECSLDAYGTIIDQSGAPASPYRLRGQYFDSETGFHYNFHRTYDPRLGNYLSPDPIGLEGGANTYLYPRNPLVWDDPFGLKCGKPAKHAEEKMDKHFQGKGYSKISVKGKNLNANGIDAIYHNPNLVPPYIIAEAKSGCAVLRWSGPGKATQQMSDAWINGAPGNQSTSRLEAALPPVKDPVTGNMVPNPHLAAIQAAPAGDVGKSVYNPDKSPPVTRTGTYGGGSSSTQTF